MSTIYNADHVAISRLLGRDYNNPLGESAFPLLARLVSGLPTLRLLDAGCGRGQSAVWWAAHSKAQVDAFDPSTDMLEDAHRRAEAQGVASRIRFHKAGFDTFSEPGPYDLVLAHDVLCYSHAWAGDAAHLAAHLAVGGFISITDYTCDGNDDAVCGVLSAWEIDRPQPFHTRIEAFRKLGLTPLLHVDTTRQYREHWARLRQILWDRRAEAGELLGQAGVASFGAQIDAILAAVDGGSFGHCWTIAQAFTS